jgi:short-chain fatty acids transporter
MQINQGGLMSSNSIQKRTLSEKFIHFCNKWTPSTMVVAYIMTAIAVILVLVLTDTPFVSFTRGQQSVVWAWSRGLWSLLELGMQMSLILITGSVLASSPPVRKFLSKIAAKPNNMGQAVLLVLAVVPILNWFHFGLGIMVGIQFGRMIIFAAKKKGYKIHLPMFVTMLYAVGITGIGISQIAPAMSAVPGALKTLFQDESVKAMIPNVVPLAQSAFLIQNIISCIIVLFVVFFLIWILRPKKLDDYEEAPDQLIAEIEAQSKIGTEKVKGELPAEKLDNSVLPSLIMGAFALTALVVYYGTGGRPDLNGFNFTMITLCILLCGSTNQFIKTVQASIGSIWGIVIQFPFYAGIFGLIAFTGLNQVIVDFFMGFATKENWPFLAYVYTSIVNFAVPNGVAKFPIVAPYTVEVAARLGVPIGVMMNSYVAGDIVTNGFIPFWALPYLAMFKLDFKKIFPYVIFASIGAYIIYSVFFLFLYH